MATADEIVELMKQTDKIGDDKSSKRLLNMYFKTKEIEDHFNVPPEERLPAEAKVEPIVTKEKKPVEVIKPTVIEPIVTEVPDIKTTPVVTPVTSGFSYDFNAFNEATKQTGDNTVWLEAPFSNEAVPKYAKLISDFGYGNNLTAALLGNAAVENGGTFASTQLERGKVKSKGRGIWQYTNETQKAYEKWLSENKDVTDGGWAQIEFMKRMLDGRIKGKDGHPFLGVGHLKEFKALTENPNTTVSQYNDWILKVPMNPSDKAKKESKSRRLLFSNEFLIMLQGRKK